MAPHDDNSNGWDQWKNLVLSELKALAGGQEKCVESVQDLRKELSEADKRLALAQAESSRKLAEELTERNRKLAVELAEFNRQTTAEIAVLKLKAGVWGLVGGTIPIALMLVLDMWKSK
jgi:hypothetical protein